MTSMMTTLASLLLTAGMTGSVTAQPTDFRPLHPTSQGKATSYNQVRPNSMDADDRSQVYIVRFEAPSAVQYHQNIIQPAKNQLNALVPYTSSEPVSQSSNVIEYVNALQQKQKHLLDAMRSKIGNFTVLNQYHYAINGVAIKASAEQARLLRSVDGIKTIEADAVRTLETDTGPLLIGADNVWAGTAGSTPATFGEGVTIAVLDTGINTDHPSFADIGGDGYDHTNPLGSGNYLGDCARGSAQLCNDKLIGVYSYPAITEVYTDTDVFEEALPQNGEDYNGHGTHVAAIAAGNILSDVAEVLPDAGQTQSDGIESGFIYEQISGVAPHANIVSFQVCLPGEDDDTYNGCYDSVIAKAIEDAIASGIVDVINFSVSGGGDPWTGAVNEAWLAAHSAGIFTSHSASNSGPDDFTTEKQSPWMTVVGATTHGRLVDYEKQIQNFSGGTFTPAPMTGSSNTGQIRAPVIYAGDVPNPNDPGNDPAQCLEPYPQGTFNGEIVVCDRGDIARIEKAKNVAAGGAGGYVLANTEGGATNLANDTYVIPGIHIDAQDAETLRSWLASGSEHIATITAADGGISVDPDAADIVADFSSRGPNSLISTLTPHLTAPGVDIFAAFSDEHFGHDITGPAPADFAYLSGTSMASPHVAGSAALIKAAHPDWTPDEIRSAMMLTAQTAVQTGNSGRAASWFDMGAGRVQIDAAMQSSLIMNETTARYRNADPSLGGEPRSLNMPAVIDSECFNRCTWQRTVTATHDGSWTAQASSDGNAFSVSVSPTAFSLAAGESQTLTIAMDTESLSNNQRGIGQISLTGNDNAILHIPVVAFASNGTIPDAIDIEAHRNFDSLLIEDVYTTEISQLTASSYGFTPATKTVETLAPDSDNSELLDDTSDGVYMLPLTLASSDIRLVAEITDSSADDMDLFVIYDQNQNGIPEVSEIIAESTSFNVTEYISLERPQPGDYWVVVQNWAGSGASQDDFTLYTGVLSNALKSNLIVEGPESVAAEEEFDLRLTWALPEAVIGDRYYGAFALSSDANATADVGFSTVDLVRDRDDVYLTTEAPARVSVGDIIPFTVNVITNDTNQDRNYVIDVTLPDSLALDTSSVTGASSVSDNQIVWEVTQTAVETPEQQVAITTAATDLQCQDGADQLEPFFSWTPDAPDARQFKTFTTPVSYLGQTQTHVTVTQNGKVNFDPTMSLQTIEQTGLETISALNQISPFYIPSDAATGMATRMVKDSQNNSVIQWHDTQSEHKAALLLRAGNDTTLPSIVMAFDEANSLAPATAVNNGKPLWQPVSVTTRQRDAVCVYPLNAAVQVVAQLQFEARVTDAAAPGPFDIQVVSAITNVEGTREERAAQFTGVQIEAVPQVAINGGAVIAITAGQSRQISVTATDANGDSLQYQWTLSSAANATLSNATTDTVTLVAPQVSEPTDLSLQVTVTDSFGNQASDTTTVSVSPATTQNRNQNSGGGGGTVQGYILLILCVMALLRKINANASRRH
ncbi:S8 family serine peptidase [Salinimonas sp. HHU 13199]|uniref:S8 family serine peptidase n=2 Tax=Salinimonas profundi TaxID=2729140 RepID=A0ABR8LDY7_9ALTE|nr:S8 family serine peptidase [Salinimonas profundi]